jgi:hypothetical protein
MDNEELRERLRIVASELEAALNSSNTWTIRECLQNTDDQIRQCSDRKSSALVYLFLKYSSNLIEQRDKPDIIADELERIRKLLNGIA